MTSPLGEGRATPAPRDRQAGVTLIEMLVAIAICALIGLAGFGMLDAILRVNERAEGDLDRLADLDRTFFVLGRDLVAADALGLRLEDGELRIGTPEGGTLRYELVGTSFRRHLGAEGDGQLLAGGVAAADWRVLDTLGDWTGEWQELPVGAPPPRAVELRLDLGGSRGGSVRRLFRLTPGLPPRQGLP